LFDFGVIKDQETHSDQEDNTFDLILLYCLLTLGEG
jgi:hypothetical protein